MANVANYFNNRYGAFNVIKRHHCPGGGGGGGGLPYEMDGDARRLA